MKWLISNGRMINMDRVGAVIKTMVQTETAISKGLKVDRPALVVGLCGQSIPIVIGDAELCERAYIMIMTWLFRDETCLDLDERLVEQISDKKSADGKVVTNERRE